MKHLTVMIKPASSLCDMHCSYCFYNDVAASRHKASLGLMSRETAAAMLKNIFCELEPGDHITFAFQGGEPGLAGLEFFSYFADEAKKLASPAVKIHYAFQTNGLMIDEDWCRFFKAYKFLIGLSLDGDAALHNRNRRDNQGKGTFGAVMKAKRLLDRFKVDYNILCVLTSENARRAHKIWDFILREEIRYIQFIPCLEPLDGQAPTALTSEKFYRFYSDIFLRWKKEADKGNLVVVRLFEDLAALLLAGRPVTCGLSGGCKPQIIVEADGLVYPCDFYVLDKYLAGDLTKHTVREIFDALVKSTFLEESRQMRTYPHPQCMDCSHNSWCRGGCKRMAQAVYGEKCGMRLFLDEHLNELLSIYRRCM